jgi:hypothetical protein
MRVDSSCRTKKPGSEPKPGRTGPGSRQRGSRAGPAAKLGEHHQLLTFLQLQYFCVIFVVKTASKYCKRAAFGPLWSTWGRLGQRPCHHGAKEPAGSSRVAQNDRRMASRGTPLSLNSNRCPMYVPAC